MITAKIQVLCPRCHIIKLVTDENASIIGSIEVFAEVIELPQFT